MKVISEWYQRRFSDPQVVVLAVLVIIGLIVVVFLGQMLAPILAAAVIAYLLTGLVSRLERHRVPRLIAVLLVFLSFMIFLLFLLLGLFPLLWEQLVQFVQSLPSIISWGQRELLRLPERYPGIISEQQVIDLMNVLRSEVMTVGQRILSLSVASVRGLAWILVYMFLIPLLIFFMLKDKERLVHWLKRFLPEDRRIVAEVWHEVDLQIGKYVRGKFWEILIVWGASYLTFSILGLQFAILISLFVGLSVLIPYIGATVMAFPVASIAYFQFGLSAGFVYVVGAYVIIQILDGNVLVTLLFSEVVNLHPVAIVMAVLVFGGLWGFWGVFFAIPLATLVQALLNAWSRRRTNDQGVAGGPVLEDQKKVAGE
jgi:putative permease